MASVTFPWIRPLWRQLVDSANSGRLPHGIGFTYAPDLGVDVMLEQLASFLLCQQSDMQQKACGTCKSCKLWQAGTHPDYLRVEPEVGKQIGVDAIRQIAHRVQQTSSQGGNKVIQIIHADRMTLQAANALLKTLEEPPQETFIQLAAERYSQLLPTIRSRLLAYAIPKPSHEDIREWLQEHCKQQVTDETLIELACQKPLRVLTQLQNNEEQVGYLAALCKGQLAVDKDLEKVHQMLALLLSEIQFSHRQALMGETPLVVTTNIKNPAPAHLLASALANSYRKGLMLRKSLQNSGVNPQILVSSWSSELARSLRASSYN